MVEPRYFEVEDGWDIIECAKNARQVIVKVTPYTKNSEQWKVLAGRFYWEGTVEIGSDLHDALLELLQSKGIKVQRSLTLEEVAAMFSEEGE